MTSAGVPSAILRPCSSTDDAIGDVHHEAHVVLDEQHRHPGPGHPPDDPTEVGRLGVVEPGRRLVEEHRVRLERHRPGDVDESLMPRRERAHRQVGDAAEPDLIEAALGVVARDDVVAVTGGERQTRRPPLRSWRTRSRPSMTLSTAVIAPNVFGVWNVRARPRRAISSACRP